MVWKSQYGRALNPLADKLISALLFGSFARRKDTAASDIDLLLVSDDLTLEAIYTAKGAGRGPTLSTREPDALHLG